jgi:hypothetical protein
MPALSGWATHAIEGFSERLVGKRSIRARASQSGSDTPRRGTANRSPRLGLPFCGSFALFSEDHEDDWKQTAEGYANIADQEVRAHQHRREPDE